MYTFLLRDFLVLKVARIEPFHRYDQNLLRSLGKARASYSFTNIHQAVLNIYLNLRITQFINLYKIFGANDIKLAVNSLLIVLLLIVEKKSICYNLLTLIKE